MGMYTEIVIAFELKKDAPEQARNVLAYMCSSKDGQPPSTPEHKLFECDRWHCFFGSCSYYFPGQPQAEFKFDDISDSWFLTARCNLKNYGGEIEAFMDWIGPYIDAAEGEFVGYSHYEETDWPTLWHLKDGALVPTRMRS